MLVLDDADKPDRVADWVELELSLGEESFSKAKLSSIIRDAAGDDPREEFISDVWRHLERRVALYLNQYFERDRDLLRRRGDVMATRLEYDVCLFFSLYGADQREGADPKLFERLSAEAIGRHIDGPYFVFGWPALENVQAAIGARVQQVADLLRERFVEAPRDQYKDRGVDIISWKPFAEPDHASRRTGQLVVLSQCAAGHDWRDKTAQLPMGSWTQYVHWTNDPIPAFAVPCVIVDDLWHDVNREVKGLVFDRVRLLNSLGDGVAENNLRAALMAWRDAQIEEHRA